MEIRNHLRNITTEQKNAEKPLLIRFSARFHIFSCQRQDPSLLSDLFDPFTILIGDPHIVAYPVPCISAVFTCFICMNYHE